VDVSKIRSELPVPPLGPSPLPILVLGGTDDIVVDVEGVTETAAFCRVEPVIVDGMAHDCMLDTRWRQAADAVASWLCHVEKET
jgi:alpha-beta hydrolase superfamily lysophospholipase